MMGVITLAIAIGASLIYTTFRFFKNHSNTWNHKVQIINWTLIIILAFIIAYAVQMNYQIADAQYCIKTAKSLSTSMNWHNVPIGNIYFGQFYALYSYSNMTPLIYLQALIFRFFSLIGIKLTFSGMIALGTYANTIMLLIAMYLVFRLVKKHCEVFTQTGFTFLLLINVPLYATVYYVYTDIPALLAVIVILAAYDAFIYSNNIKSKASYIFIIILTSIIGALFKSNVLIALFAIIIHYFLTHNWKHNIKFILLLLIPTMLGISGIKRGITITSPISQNQLGLPSIHWINMSFDKTNTDGGFNFNYYKHTLALKNKYKNNIKVSKIEFHELVHNIIENPKHFLFILYKKIGVTYSISNYNFNYFFKTNYLKHPNMKKSIIGKLLYENYSSLLLYAFFIFQLSLFSIIGLGILVLIKNKIYINSTTPFMLTLFGIMFLLLFWESCSRYLLPFIGVIYFIVCTNIQQLLKKHNFSFQFIRK